MERSLNQGRPLLTFSAEFDKLNAELRGKCNMLEIRRLL